MISRVSFFLILPMFSLTFGCHSSSDFKSGGAIGVTRNDKVDDKETDEDETADEPVEVSGSFLTCSFMDSETQVVGSAKAQPEGELDIACGLFRQIGDKFGPVDDSRLKLQTRILTNQGKLLPAKFRRLPLGTQMQHITTVPVKHLSGTIHVDYYDPESGNYSSRRKSIPSITEFSAKVQYNVEEDESVGRFLTKEQPLDGSIDLKDGEEPSKSPAWWETVIEVISVAFGHAASVPASYDNGSTIYQPATHVHKPSQKPDAQNTNFPINQPSKPAGSIKPGQQIPTTPTKPTEEKLVDTTIKPEVVDDPFVKVDMSKPELKPEMKQEPASEAKPVGENTGGNQPADTANPVQESESKSTDPGDTATPAEQ
jgi:hypothetical protein